MTTDLFAYLSYRDAPAALAWLRAVGFEVLMRQDAADGGVVHAEVRLGAAVVMVATADREYETPPLHGTSTGGGVYLGTDDVDALFARAMEAGAITVLRPESTEWGGRRARVLDPEGHEWSFGTYRPGRQAER